MQDELDKKPFEGDLRELRLTSQREDGRVYIIAQSWRRAVPMVREERWRVEDAMTVKVGKLAETFRNSSCQKLT